MLMFFYFINTGIHIQLQKYNLHSSLRCLSISLFSYSDEMPVAKKKKKKKPKQEDNMDEPEVPKGQITKYPQSSSTSIK